MSLNSAQIRHLRGLAHHLKPVVMLGNDGLTDGVVGALEEALELHELLKLKTAGEDRAERDAVVAAVLERTGAELVQRIGHVAVLFRRAKEPKIDLPGLPLIKRKEEIERKPRYDRKGDERSSGRGDSPYGRAPSKSAAPKKGKPFAKPRLPSRDETLGRTPKAPKRPSKIFGRAKTMSSRRGGNRPS